MSRPRLMGVRSTMLATPRCFAARSSETARGTWLSRSYQSAKACRIDQLATRMCSCISVKPSSAVSIAPSTPLIFATGASLFVGPVIPDRLRGRSRAVSAAAGQRAQVGQQGGEPLGLEGVVVAADPAAPVHEHEAVGVEEGLVGIGGGVADGQLEAPRGELPDRRPRAGEERPTRRVGVEA